MFQRITITFLFSLGCLTAFQFLHSNFQELQANERRDYIETVVDSIVSGLSPEELVGQVIHIAIPNKTLEKTATEEMEKTKPGGVILFGKNLGSPQEIKSLNSSLQEKARSLGLPPLLISTDQEGGRVYRVKEGVTAFPGAMATGQSGDESHGYKVGFFTSYELNQLGINFLLAPILDINNNPENPVINTRSFGSHAERVSKVAVAYEKGARRGGAIPVIKHFPGHGDTNVDSHLGLPKINKTLDQLEQLELIPFRRAIEGGAKVVMSAHIVYPLIDEKYPATLSKTILTDILRGKLGFDGIIITDAMEMHAISKNYQKDNPGTLAILAGADIVLLTSWGDTAKNFRESLLKSYTDGVFDVEGKNLLKEAVKRQIRLKLQDGIYKQTQFELPIQNPSFEAELDKVKLDREKEKDQYLQNKNLLRDITRDTIRSFPKEWNTSTNPHHYFLRSPVLKKVLAEAGQKNNEFKSLLSVLNQKNPQVVVFDGTTEAELKTASKWADIYPRHQFLHLHSATPFLTLPQRSNLRVILSFSNTPESMRALIETLNPKVKTKIPVVDLILKESYPKSDM